MDTSSLAVTVKVCAGLVTPLKEAVIWVVPIARVEAKPVALIVAVAGVALFQLTEAVMLAVD